MSWLSQLFYYDPIFRFGYYIMLRVEQTRYLHVEYTQLPIAQDFLFGPLQLLAMFFSLQQNIAVASKYIFRLIQTYQLEDLFIILVLVLLLVIFELNYVTSLLVMNQSSKWTGFAVVYLIPLYLGIHVAFQQLAKLYTYNVIIAITYILSAYRIPQIIQYSYFRMPPKVIPLQITFEIHSLILLVDYIGDDAMHHYILTGFIGLQLIILHGLQLRFQGEQKEEKQQKLRVDSQFQPVIDTSSLSLGRYLEQSNDLECTICLEVMFKRTQDQTIDDSISQLNVVQIISNDVIETRCKHFFHKKCLLAWLNQNESCPLCKTII